MKSTYILSALAGLTFGLVSCSSPSNPSGSGEQTISAGVKSYTSDTCIVSGNKLGSMGDPVTIVHNGQEVKFCCNPCIKKFKANPDKYLAKLR